MSESNQNRDSVGNDSQEGAGIVIDDDDLDWLDVGQASLEEEVPPQSDAAAAGGKGGSLSNASQSRQSPSEHSFSLVNDDDAVGHGSASVLSFPQSQSIGRDDAASHVSGAYSDGGESTGLPRPDMPHPPDVQDFVWGTDVDAHTFSSSLYEYLISRLDSQYKPIFPALLLAAYVAGKHEVDLPLHPLSESEVPQAADAYSAFVHNPRELMPYVQHVVRTVWKGIVSRNAFADALDIPFDLPLDRGYRIVASPCDLRPTVGLRDLGPDQLETLVSIGGMVTKVSTVIPEIRRGFFRCVACGKEDEHDVELGVLKSPSRCTNCTMKGTFRLIYDRSRYENAQLVRLQESPQHVPEGDTPSSMILRVYGDLVDSVSPGDYVEVTGVYTTCPVPVRGSRAKVSSVQRTILDALHMKIGSSGSGLISGDKFNTDDSVAPDPELIRKYKELSQRPDIYEILEASVAPGVFGMAREKQGILAMLFGGVRKVFTGDLAQECPGIRGQLNILLCGDPGVAKSQLLARVHRLAPRGVYTSAKGTTSVGLTAYVSRDTDTGELTLESGALVLSDRGICCVDEFDKMGEDTRAVLHEAMEQQTVSVAKAGIVATLNARAAVLAAANPVDSRWNTAKTVPENINVEPTLLSRFDLIFLLLDVDDLEADRRLASHIMHVFAGTDLLDPQAAGSNEGVVGGLLGINLLDEDAPVRPKPRHVEPLNDIPSHLEELLTEEELSTYIAIAQRFCQPRLTPEAKRHLASTYTNMRKAGVAAGRKIITCTPRHLESLVRISEARAKMRLSPLVEAMDVHFAAELMGDAFKTWAVDSETGLVDLGRLQAGPNANSASLEGVVRRLADFCRVRFQSAGHFSVSVSHLRGLFNAASGGHHDSDEFARMLDLLPSVAPDLVDTVRRQ